MLKGFSNNRWTSWFPRETLAPVFSQYVYNDDKILNITLKNNFQYGKWVCKIENLVANTCYDFYIEYKAENVISESKSIYMLITWNNSSGEPLQRDYITLRHELSNGWRSLQGIAIAPLGTAYATIELGARWCAGLSVSWSEISVEMTKSTPCRKVKVVTTYMESRKNLQENIQAVMETIDKAGALNPDIICFTESVISNFVNLPLEEKCQKVPGQFTMLAAQKARKYNTYIILTMHEIDQDTIYNTAVLIGRNGEIEGKYRKMHVPLAEAEEGITPGEEYGVFDTDFGRIGIMICWDQAFPEAARILRLKGAEIIFLPTIGEEPLQQRARARDNGVYVAVSGMYSPNSSRIINPLGDIIGEVFDVEAAVCAKEIDLEQRYQTYWLSVGPCNGEPRSLYIKERRNDTYQCLGLDV